MVDFNRQSFSPSMELIRPTKGPMPRQYFLQVANSSTIFRGYDTTANVYVTWSVNSTNPPANMTTPNLVGSLIDAHIEVV